MFATRASVLRAHYSVHCIQIHTPALCTYADPNKQAPQQYSKNTRFLNIREARSTRIFFLLYILDTLRNPNTAARPDHDQYSELAFSVSSSQRRRRPHRRLCLSLAKVYRCKSCHRLWPITRTFEIYEYMCVYETGDRRRHDTQSIYHKCGTQMGEGLSIRYT